MEKIISLQNPKIKKLKRLEKASERREQQLFLIEGLREIVLAHRAGYTINELFICPGLLKETKEYSLEEVGHKTQDTRHKQALAFEITEEIYRSLAYRDSTEGVLATAIPRQHTLQNLSLKKNPLILVIEGVEKPGNLGAMLRTCDAAGVDAVIVCDAKTDLYNPNVIRSSIGTVFTNQLAICNSEEAVRFLKQHGVSIFAAELEAEKFHYQATFSGPIAIVVGTEATGLSAQWMKAADQKIKIPMQGEIDSLNVSVSAAILLFEAVRQRTIA